LRTHLSDDVAQTDWLLLYRSVAWALAEQAKTLFGLEEPDPLRAEEELATTLACAVIEPAGPGKLRSYVTGVGDSGAWLLSATVFREILGGKTVSEAGLVSAAVAALPQVPLGKLSPAVVEFGGGDVLLIGSDGIGDPLGNGDGGVGDLFRAALTGHEPPSLIEFSHAVDFSRELFDDDRTLVAVWPKGPSVARFFD
jgi:hypothetical protein